MDKRAIIISIVITITLFGCWKGRVKSEEKKDEFYATLGGWDWVRVPLIKPYEVKKIDPEVTTNSWSVEFFNSLGPYNVKRIDVKDSVIYILSGKVDAKEDSTLVNLRNVPTGWFIVDIRKKVEKGFTNELEFAQYVKANGYQSPNWYDIDSLSEALGNRMKLPWLPK